MPDAPYRFKILGLVFFIHHGRPARPPNVYVASNNHGYCTMCQFEYMLSVTGAKKSHQGLEQLRFIRPCSPVLSDRCTGTHTRQI